MWVERIYLVLLGMVVDLFNESVPYQVDTVVSEMCAVVLADISFRDP